MNSGPNKSFEGNTSLPVICEEAIDFPFHIGCLGEHCSTVAMSWQREHVEENLYKKLASFTLCGCRPVCREFLNILPKTLPLWDQDSATRPQTNCGLKKKWWSLLSAPGIIMSFEKRLFQAVRPTIDNRTRWAGGITNREWHDDDPKVLQQQSLYLCITLESCRYKEK